MASTGPGSPAMGHRGMSPLGAVSGLVIGFTERRHGSVVGEADAVHAALRERGTDPLSLRRFALRQVHGVGVAVAGPAPLPAPPEADAAVSAEPGVLLVIQTADCVPALAVVEQGGRALAVAAIHAGWRGLVAGVLQAGIAELGRLATGRAVALLGPCIGACCFEVGDDVAARIAAVAGDDVLSPGPAGRPHADLPLAAARLLRRAGAVVPEALPPCTRCRPDIFHSFRAAGQAAGRNGAFIGLLPPADRA